MESSLIRNKLHEYIDAADDRKVEAIYTILEEEIEHHYMYDEETISMLHKRRENHLKGISKSYTAEESLEKIRNHKK